MYFFSIDAINTNNSTMSYYYFLEIDWRRFWQTIRMKIEAT